MGFFGNFQADIGVKRNGIWHKRTSSGICGDLWGKSGMEWQIMGFFGNSGADIRAVFLGF